MKYKIVVDKQSRTNPSDERREYEIDIEELRCKGDVCDSLVITKEEDYIIRRLELTKYFVLKELAEPIKQVIPNINIELFEGDNYIYIIDMAGNKFYAEYLIKNEFNDVYATKAEMSSAINQSAREVVISVDEKLTEYSKTEEMQSIIQALSNQIMLEVSKKVGNDEIISKINMTPEKIKILAKSLELEGYTTINGGFKVDEQGNMEAVNGKFNGGQVILQGGTRSSPTFIIGNMSNGSYCYISETEFDLGDISQLSRMSFSANSGIFNVFNANGIGIQIARKFTICISFWRLSCHW